MFAAERPALEQHLSSCQTCTAALNVVSATLPREPPPGASMGLAEALDDTQQLTVGTLVGRYPVLSRLGAGAMGVVYGAYDPQLDRRIAVKVLRAHHAGDAHVLRKEAQALGKLNHPNVVSVYDLGAIGDGAFVVMEYVDGGTLRAWAEERPRTWREVLARFQAAGEGLAAAHRVGIVHRDVKPDNILVGRDGRTCVTDFGLAIGEGEGAGVAGTPAYMAPEVFDGKPADARSDQYSFCVALYELLVGQRPFDGKSLAELREAQRRFEAGGALRGARLPGFVKTALRRGLAQEPAARFPSIDALLDALGRGRRARLGFGAIAATLLLGVGAAAATLGVAHTQRECRDADEWVAAEWSGPRAALAARLAQVVPGPVATRSLGELDRWVDRWSTNARGFCEDTRVRKTHSEPVLDARMQCLSRARGELLSYVRALLEADAPTFAQVARGALGLSESDDCALSDPSRSVRLYALPQDPELRRRARALIAELDRARGYRLTNQPRKLEAILATLEVEERTLAYPPASADFWEYRAWTLASRQNGHEAAMAWLRSGLNAAQLLHEDGAAGAFASASGPLASTNPELAQFSLDLARAHARQTQRVASLIPVDLAEAEVRRTQGKFTEAEQLFARVAASHAATAQQRLKAADGLVRVASEAGRPDDARRFAEDALRITEAIHGPESLEAAVGLQSLAYVHLDLAQPGEALRLMTRSAEIHRHGSTDGGLPPAVAVGLGLALSRSGRVEEARNEYRRAIADSRTAGLDELLADALQNLALLEWEAGRFNEAEPLARESSSLRSRAGGRDYRTISVDALLGSILAYGGHCAEAATRLAEDCPAYEPLLGAGHAEAVDCLRDLAAARTCAGDFPGGVRDARAALARSSNEEQPASLARLAAVLVASRNFAEALVVAQRALALDAGAPTAPIVIEASLAVAEAQAALGHPVEQRQAAARVISACVDEPLARGAGWCARAERLR